MPETTTRSVWETRARCTRLLHRQCGRRRGASPKDLRQALLRLRPQHLRDAMIAGLEDEVVRRFAQIATLLARGGAPSPLAPWLRGATLAALEKPQGGHRPVTAKVRASNVSEELRDHLEPLQPGVGSKSACEAIVHVVRRWCARHASDRGPLPGQDGPFKCIQLCGSRSSVVLRAQGRARTHALGGLLLQGAFTLDPGGCLSAACNKEIRLARPSSQSPFTTQCPEQGLQSTRRTDRRWISASFILTTESWRARGVLQACSAICCVESWQTLGWCLLPQSVRSSRQPKNSMPSMPVSSRVSCRCQVGTSSCWAHHWVARSFAQHTHQQKECQSGRPLEKHRAVGAFAEAIPADETMCRLRQAGIFNSHSPTRIAPSSVAIVQCQPPWSVGSRSRGHGHG